MSYNYSDDANFAYYSAEDPDLLSQVLENSCSLRDPPRDNWLADEDDYLSRVFKTSGSIQKFERKPSQQKEKVQVKKNPHNQGSQNFRFDFDASDANFDSTFQEILPKRPSMNIEDSDFQSYQGLCHEEGMGHFSSCGQSLRRSESFAEPEVQFDEHITRPIEEQASRSDLEQMNGSNSVFSHFVSQSQSSSFLQKGEFNHESKLENSQIRTYVEQSKGVWEHIYNADGKPNAEGLIKEFIHCMYVLGYLTHCEDGFGDGLNPREARSIDEIVAQVNTKIRLGGTRVGGAFITIACYSEAFKNEVAAIQQWILLHESQFTDPAMPIFVYTTEFREFAPRIHNYLWNNKSRIRLSKVFRDSVREWTLHPSRKEFPFLALFFLFQSSMGGEHEPNLFLACKETGTKNGRDHLHMAMIYEDGTTMSNINTQMKAGFWSKICQEFNDPISMSDTLHLEKLTELGGLLNYMFKEGKQERYYASNPTVHRNTALFRTRYIEQKVAREKRNHRGGSGSVSSMFSELMVRWVLFMIYALKDEKHNLLRADAIRFISNSFEQLRTTILVTQELQVKFSQYIVQYGKTLPEHFNGLLNIAKKPFIAKVKQIVLGCNYAPLDYHLKMVSIWISSRLAGIKNAATQSYRQKSTWLVGGPAIGKSTIFELLKRCYVGVYPLAKRSGGFQLDYDKDAIFGQLDEAGTALGGQSIERGAADMVNMLKDWTENGTVEINQKYKSVQTRESFFPLIITSNNAPGNGISKQTSKNDREALYTYFKLPEPGQNNKDHWEKFIAQYSNSNSRIMAFQLGKGMYDEDLDTNPDDKINWSISVKLCSGAELSITSEELYTNGEGEDYDKRQDYLQMAELLDMGPELENFIRLLNAK